MPYCIASTGAEPPWAGVGIGNQILDLAACVRLELLEGLPRPVLDACSAPVLNPLIATGPAGNAALREHLTDLLGEAAWRSRASQALVRLQDVIFHRPVDVPNYTDFYASIEHAEGVGRLFRPEQPLLPNYRHLPIAYHGRASSIVVSGTPIARPYGQVKPADKMTPRFVPTAQMDYEMEIGAYLYGGNTLGEPIPLGHAAEQIFGLSLVNDWSARDIQSWEYQPLGPFLGKSFATSVSPWVVPVAAFEPFRVPARPRGADDPALLPYLNSSPDAARTFAISIEAWLETGGMRRSGVHPVLLGKSGLETLYWTLPQLIAHHTSNGCNLIVGDMLATGTISGVRPGEQGCLLEITRRGASPLALPSGETRAFLDDGDEVILRGFCEREGFPRVSLGECRGTIVAAAAGRG